MRKILVVLLAVTMVLSGCFFGAAAPCDVDDDCAQTRFCAQGACVPPEEIDCNDDRDCPQGTLCDRIDGFCYFP